MNAAPGLDDEDGVYAAYQAHGAELYRFVLRGLGDSGAAEDVVQETFLRAWRAADRFDPELASLRGWLFAIAIARNAMIDHARDSTSTSANPGDVVTTGVRSVSEVCQLVQEPGGDRVELADVPNRNIRRNEPSVDGA